MDDFDTEFEARLLRACAATESVRTEKKVAEVSTRRGVSVKCASYYYGTSRPVAVK